MNPIKKAKNAVKNPKRTMWLVGTRVRYKLNRPFKTNMKRGDLDLTTECNLYCHNCNRACGLAPSDEKMTIEQITKVVDELVEAKDLELISVVGGEPTLYPHLDLAFEQLKRVKDAHPKCEIRLITNGYAPNNAEILKKVPEWMTIENGNKTTNELMFIPFNQAPIDYPEFEGANYELGCVVTKDSGIGMTYHGHYICAMAGAIDRVFGFDIGAKSLAELPEKVREQKLKCCPLCGNYRHRKTGQLTKEQKLSPTWQKAISNYKANKPKLTPL